MKKKALYAVLLIFTVFMFAGCMTYEDYVKVDDIRATISSLQQQVEEKTAAAKAGELSTTEAIAFVTQANQEIAKARDELRNIKDTGNVGWAEILVSIAASLLGGTGIVRAWRGPTHKNVLTGTGT